MTQAKIRAIDTSELPRLLDLFAEGFPSHPAALWERRFETWWISNPSVKPGMPIGWVLEDVKSNIVGFMGSIPVKFLVNGEPGIAVAASSWYVKPEYRGVHSLSFPLAFQRQQTPSLFLSTTPTETVKHILRRLEFSSLEFPFQEKEYWVVFRTAKILSRVRLRHFWTRNKNPLLAAATIPLKVLGRLAYLRKNRSLIGYRNENFHCSLAATCDSSFTDLWENSKRQKTTTLYRDAETLNWLLGARFPEGSRFLIKCQGGSSGRIKGYMLFDLEESSTGGSRIMQMKDLYLPAFEEGALLAMIAYALVLAKEKGVSLLKLWATSAECDFVLRKHVPFQKTTAYSYLYKFGQVAKSRVGPDHLFIPSLIDPDRGLI